VAAEIVFPYRVLLQCFERFGEESPHTRIELIESVLAGTNEALAKRLVDLAISGQIPPGFVGDPLVRLRIIPAAHPDHPLHKLGRQLTQRDLRAHRQLVVRETDALRATRLSMDTAQRWTVSHMSTSIVAATMGYGFGWFSENKIASELAAGTLKPLRLREGGERCAAHLVCGSRERRSGNAAPAAIIRELVAGECQGAAEATRAVRRVRRAAGSGE
jgi:DNA-binding transcriptional LysR family regulator